MMMVTAKELYGRALEYEAMWTKQAMESKEGTWAYGFAIKKLAIQRIVLDFLKTLPMDKVMHDGTGYSKEYARYLEIVNS